MRRLEATWLDQIRRRGDGVRGVPVLVACSGGGDSVALLAFLHTVRASLDLELAVAHADHGLRPESEADAAFVRELCRCLDLDLVEARLDVTGHAQREGLGLETAARELRWAWLRTEAASLGAPLVATGHTLEDHTETVFLRLARGGGLGALTPLPARQEIRWSPLIEARRADLRAYLTQRGLPWREDATNTEDFTARNRWRKLLEGLRTEAPALDAHLWETHRQASELLDLRDAWLMETQGTRWGLDSDGLWLEGPFAEPELRRVLEAAARAAGWHREAATLRRLAAWACQRMQRRNRCEACWGGWRIRPEGSRWRVAHGSPVGADPSIGRVN